jgi:uncharacterized protein YkwD
MSSGMLKQSRLTILLSINAAVILVVGILITSAIWLNGGVEFKMVGERSDVVAESAEKTELIDSSTNSDTAPIDEIDNIGNDDYISTSSHEYDNSNVKNGELWNESNITIFATPDVDICVGGGLTDLGDMYWQTSNSSVISGFYNTARTWLGYTNDGCKYPIISGTGTTTITAGTYDGKRKDSVNVTVVEPPIQQWKHEVLTLVNKIRTKNSLGQLSWGETCESAADIRANETKTLYSHTRPNGSNWDTVCPIPASGGSSGENLAVGNAAVSPATVVAQWMASKAHRENILNPEYTKLAVGFVFDPNSTYRTYWSQLFSTY